MSQKNVNRPRAKWGIATLVLAGLAPLASPASILYQNGLPTSGVNTGTGQSDVAPVYNAPPLGDSNRNGSPTEPYILGDQFYLAPGTNTITSFTVYEVDDTSVAGPTSSATTSWGSEFSALDLYIGADGCTSPCTTGLSLASSSYTATQVMVGGDNYKSINNGDYYPIWQVTFTFSAPFTLTGGYYAFAIGDTPIADNTFAMLMSDPANGNASCTTYSICDGYFYYFADGSGGNPLETYSYAPGDGLIANYTNRDEVDADFTIQGTISPEPGTFGLLGAGIGAVLLKLRRRSKKSSAI